MGVPWKSHSRLKANFSRAQISLLCQTWSLQLGWIRSRVGAQSCWEPTQLLGHGQALHSCLPPALVKHPCGCGGKGVALSGLGRKVQRPGSTWPWGSCQSLKAALPSRGQRALVSSLGKIWLRKVPESWLVGCRKPSMEADIHKQQPGCGHRVQGDPAVGPE